MIDRPKRDAGSALVLRLRDGGLTNDEFEEAWPEAGGDNALDAVASMVWAFYDDLDTHCLTGRRALTPEGHAALTRYALFLKTDLPYAWPTTNFYRIAGVGRTMLILSLGLLWPIDLWIKSRNRRFASRLEASGDLDVWPFLRRADYEAARPSAS